MADVPKPGNNSAHRSTDSDVRALLENLTGPARGQISWLSCDRLQISVDEDRSLRIDTDLANTGSDALTCARFSWGDGTYTIDAQPNQDIWVNGRKVGTAHLMHGDMIEFGEDGPMSRFRLCRNALPTRWPVEEIVSDAVAYARSSRRSFGARMGNVAVASARRLLLETSLAFRVSVVVVLLILTTLVAMQYRSDLRFERQIAADSARLEALTIALTETRRDALTTRDLTALRTQLDLQLGMNAERLALLERQLDSSARIIRNATASVAFLQGAYGLRHIQSGDLLRHVLSPDGQPLLTPFGRPMVGTDGTGKPFEIQFTGTGFLIEDSRHLVTNRHVALPWTNKDRFEAFERSGYAPEMLKLLAFFPGTSSPVEVSLLATSDAADLAVLSVPATAGTAPGLTLSDGLPQIGDQVVVLGYSTGLRVLLAQAGRDFLQELEQSGETDFWAIAMRLSERDRIAPLASRGIIAQITDKAVIYDAEITVGGSGGPALDRNGHVIAVNAAILPEFGGANIGVPVRDVQLLLQSVTTAR